jgi:hypothetical protein
MVGIAETMLPLERGSLGALQGRTLADFPAFTIMYAATLEGLIYHLVIAEHDHRTFCGLYLVGDLYVLEEKPKDRILCQRCERIAEERLNSNRLF